MPSKSSTVALAGLMVAAATLAGCQNDKTGTAEPAAPPPASSAPAGTAALSADEILQRAQNALTTAGSYRAEGTLNQQGQQTRIDLRVSGQDFATTMAFGKAEVELLATGGKKYLRPNEQFWVMSTDARQGKVLARVLGGKWVTGAEKDQSFADLFSIGSAAEFLKPTGPVSKGERREIGGAPAIGLVDSGDPDSVLYVATTGEPYPLQLTGKGGSELTFSDFGAGFDALEAPAAGQVVDLGQLAGK